MARERVSEDDSGIGCGTSLELLSGLGSGNSVPDTPLEAQPPSKGAAGPAVVVGEVHVPDSSVSRQSGPIS